MREGSFQGKAQLKESAQGKFHFKEAGVMRPPARSASVSAAFAFMCPWLSRG
eukprot:CAMPEP_0179376674 /NCGR_PEP_ID=MMETSP0797-20121207/88439_1 /TAXON_ID=47934 /ORGANISM="Dinophysis acuminata, Strain DAEP01" /LENGTH=51 /DNA_ID=CAMNT_0021092717 /DNA_START=16 /DNA_END=167 /DNA_ORIENTATION=+